jgi:hypothetical protein
MAGRNLLLCGLGKGKGPMTENCTHSHRFEKVYFYTFLTHSGISLKNKTIFFLNNIERCFHSGIMFVGVFLFKSNSRLKIH